MDIFLHQTEEWWYILEAARFNVCNIDTLDHNLQMYFQVTPLTESIRDSDGNEEKDFSLQ